LSVGRLETPQIFGARDEWLASANSGLQDHPHGRPDSPTTREQMEGKVRRQCRPRRIGRAGVAHRADVTRLDTLPRLTGL